MSRPQFNRQSESVSRSRMGFDSQRQSCDPIKRIEREMTAYNPDIDNSGGSLYNLETFCIVHKFETAEERERRENDKEGHGYISNLELTIDQECQFFSEYIENDWDSDFIPSATEAVWVQFGDAPDEGYFDNGFTCSATGDNGSTIIIDTSATDPNAPQAGSNQTTFEAANQTLLSRLIDPGITLTSAFRLATADQQPPTQTPAPIPANNQTLQLSM